jgi:putative SOS response-associated peptidase YedK
MCGRFALTVTAEEVAGLFGLADLEGFPPRYNIAPTQPILLVTAGPRRMPGSNLPDRSAMLARWGLIPGWTKNPKDMPLLINARSESAIEKPAFKTAMRHRRVLVPTTGFYEWKRDARGRAQAWYMRPKGGGVIGFAGLLEQWHEPGGSELDTAAILTTSASSDIAHIHHRMPVVIRPEHFARWLDCLNQEPRDVKDLMQPVEPGFFEPIPVSDLVNKVENMGPEVQERVEHPEAVPEEAKPAPAAQLSLF